MWCQLRKTLTPALFILMALAVAGSLYVIGLSSVASVLMFILVGRTAWSFVPRLERDGAAQEVLQLSPLENRDYVSAMRRVFFIAMASWAACSLSTLLLYAFLRPASFPTLAAFTVYLSFLLSIYYWLAVMPELGCFARIGAIAVSAVFLALIHVVGSRFAMEAIRNGVWWSAVLIVLVFSLPGIGLAVTSYFWATADIRGRIDEALRHRLEREPLF